MRNGQMVAVVVPAFDEEERVARVVTRIPAWVDRVVVVDDGSRDGTARAAQAAAEGRAVVLRHASNRGVGAAIVTGYRDAVAAGASVVAVMAGDDQMAPDDLAAVVGPVLSGRAAYVKGNRFVHVRRRDMPFARRLAGRLLAALTRATTGLFIYDSQCGYTALSARAVRRLPLEELWQRYGYPNDLLGLLAAHDQDVVEVPVRPVYAGEQSGIRPWHAAVVAYVILRRWYLSRAQRRASPFTTTRSRAG
jgi:glycosyltransferase involved in cell wall biosynthesis